MCSSPKRSLALVFLVFYMCFNAPNLLADPIDDGIEALAIRDYPTALLESGRYSEAVEELGL